MEESKFTIAQANSKIDKEGNFLASCSTDLTIKIWDMNNYKCIKTLNGHDHTVSAVQYLPNEELLLSASRDQTIKLWETDSGYCKKTFKGHDKWVRDVKVNQTGDKFASCSDDE